MKQIDRYWNERYSKHLETEITTNKRSIAMKDMKDINIKELKLVVKELNDSGLLEHKVRLVGISNTALVDAFTKAVETISEDKEIPEGITEFYNDLYADEIDTDEETEDDDVNEDEEEETEDEEEETEEEDDEDEEETEEEDDEDDEDGDEIDVENEIEEEKPKKEMKLKAEKKKTVMREKPEKKKKSLEIKKRAEIIPKLSLVKKVTNLLNFSDHRYKKTAYFPLDCETIRILETNVGLYPTEILPMMKQDKKVAKKLEKYSADVLLREINKIKSVYSYIVGAIREDRADGKLRNIISSLLAGKEVPPEVAHYSTVKIARRALLAYMDVTGIDYSVMKEVRKELVKKASEKKIKAEPKPKKSTKK